MAGHVTHHRTGRGPPRLPATASTSGWSTWTPCPTQPWYLAPFAGFRAADHLGDPDRSIKANVEHYLALNGIELGAVGRIVMLANARVLGHVFDPLIVFWCFDSARRAGLRRCRGAQHLRRAARLPPAPRPRPGTATTDKAFHVSPFFDVSGRYELRFDAVRRDRVHHRHRCAATATVAFTRDLPRPAAPATTAALAGQLAPQTSDATAGLRH